MVFTKFWESNGLLEKPVYAIYVFMLCFFFSLASFEWLPFYRRKTNLCHVERWSWFDSKWSCTVSAYRTMPECFQKLFNWSVTLCFCRGSFSNLHHINPTCPPVLNWGHLFMTTMTNMHQNRLDHGLLFIGCDLRVTHLINIKVQITLAYKEFRDYKMWPEWLNISSHCLVWKDGFSENNLVQFLPT